MTDDFVPAHFSPSLTSAEREDPPPLADERSMLVAYLEYERATFAAKAGGLDAAQLSTRSVEPSSMSLHGLLRHLTGVERWWFRIQFAGERLDLLYYSDDDPDQDFDSLDGDVDLAWATWRAECDAARAVVAAAPSLDATGTRRQTGEPFSLRWVVLRMIAEYARHNGHADLLRERLDGATGM